jgi:hypothetical protein
MSTFVHGMSEKCHFVSQTFYDNEHLSDILLTFCSDIRDSPPAITIMALRKAVGSLKKMEFTIYKTVLLCFLIIVSSQLRVVSILGSESTCCTGSNDESTHQE